LHTLKAVASACACCATLAADLIASAALRLARRTALEKLAPMELVTLAMFSENMRLALCEADRITSEMARSALALASSALRDASAEACDMAREADSAAPCCRRALASCCSVWLRRCVACCSDWLSCWLAWLTERDCSLSCWSWLLSAWIWPWSWRARSDGCGVIMAWHPFWAVRAGSAGAGYPDCGSSRPSSTPAPGILFHSGSALPAPPMVNVPFPGAYAAPFATQAQLEPIRRRTVRNDINGFLAMTVN